MHISRQFARTAGHRGNAVLSNDDLVRFAPSVVAVEAHSSRRRNVTTRAVNGIDQNVGLNRALWMLTQRMAEIRGVPAA